MATEIQSGYCDDCKARRRITRETPSVLVNLIVTILTLGLWLPIWGLEILFRGAYRCCVCGSKVAPG